MDLGLASKTAIVTGGAAGLGAAISAAFLDEGANTVVFDILPKSSSIDPRLWYVQGDVTQPTDIDRAMHSAIEKFGAVDILINNAGIWPDNPILNMTKEDWERVLRVNLIGPFLFSQCFIRYLKEAGRPGCIINIASPAAFQGTSRGHSHYAAAKAGLVNLTQSLVNEVSGLGIRVLAVAPGIMRTEMTRATINERGDQYYLKKIPLGRFADPEEIAGVVVFMASGRASYVTGTTINVTGGLLMR